MEDEQRILRAVRKLRKIGGSQVVTLPSDVLSELNIPAGSRVLIKTKKGIKEKLIELEWF